MIQVYVYDRHFKSFYPFPEQYVKDMPESLVVIGPVLKGPSQGEFEYMLIQKGWPAGVVFPQLEEDPIPF